MILRREFITLLGVAAAWPLAVRAQQGDRLRRIGVFMLLDENDPVAKAYVAAFTQALADLGWTDGRNVRMDLRWTGADANRMRALAQELVGLQPDVILVGGDLPPIAVQRDTQTIPIVFVGTTDPSPCTSSRGSTARVGTSPVSPTSNSRWQTSGLSCSRRSRPASSGPQSCSIPTRPPHRPLCPQLRRRPGHSRSCQSRHSFIVT